MILTVLVFLAILGLLVFIHELGHFLAAKRNGVRVEEFAFGFRPRLFSKQVGETTYAINLIPLGGYVKLFGEDPSEMGPESFRSKSIAQRFVILVAGTAMNFLLGWLILTILFIAGFSPLFPGVGSNPFVESTQNITVTELAADSPAATAGLQVGDKLTKIDGERIATDQEFVLLMNSLRGKETAVSYERSDQEKTVKVTPRLSPPEGQGPLGVGINSNGEVSATAINAPAAALLESGKIVKLSAEGFVGFVKNLVIKQEVSDDVTGLVGVGALTGIARRLGVDYLAQLVVVISIGLAVVNLMPILPLDGGHIAALGYEKVAGRPLTDKQLGVLATAGLAFVLLMFVVVTYKDIIRFNVLERIF